VNVAWVLTTLFLQSSGHYTTHTAIRTGDLSDAYVEECFGWLKTIALLRKVRHRGIFKVGWVFTFAAAAYNSRPNAEYGDWSEIGQGRRVFCGLADRRLATSECPQALLRVTE